ncbi:Calreticulin family-domain-containing protein [Scheffersomyces coipomensis]|uniref:Calreticulin family-domain-containing protein n=1 Tax=Scheffersomyces coipomensis TaxID=1788519 RepID=UPI00315D84CF
MIKLLTSLLALSSIVACNDYIPFDTTRLDKSSIFEQFLYKDFPSSPWLPSKGKAWDNDKKEFVRYTGKWNIEPSFKNPAYGSDDKGLVLKTVAARHAVYYKLPTPFDNTDQDLVLQYELKLQSGLNCGGAYIKLLDQSEDYRGFNGQTPYQIMFGPDKCGSNNKIHFIINRPNPITGKVEEKHLRAPPMAKINDLSNLYTLILTKNQDFEIRVNGEVAKAGNLHSNVNLLSPPLYPNPALIDDPNDIKPFDWDDDVLVPDPNAELPEDYELKHLWEKIPDLKAVKPEEWDENEPLTIPDLESEKPQDWDDEEDGEWTPPHIRNPQCDETGCGPWSPPLIKNPLYKGPFIPRNIPNPNYKGPFKPKQIPNPDFHNDTNPSNIGLVGGLGFELWSMDNNIMFNNIYLGHSIKEAELIGNETYAPKLELEFEYKQNHKVNIKNEPIKPPPTFDEIINDNKVYGFIQFLVFIKFFLLKQFLDIVDFYYEFLRDPLNLITNQPIKFVLYCMIFVTFFTFICGLGAVLLFLITGGGQANPVYEKETRSKTKIEDDDDDDAKYDDEDGVVIEHPSNWEEREEPRIIELKDSDDISSATGAFTAEAKPRRRKA